MEQDKAIAIIGIDVFQASRTGIDVASDQIIQQVKAGERNPVEVKVWVKAVEEVLERVKKDIAENVMTEADKYSEKTFTAYGATITKAEHGTKYDYSGCGDTVWERLDANTKDAAAKQKLREDFLKSLKEPMTVVDENTSEVITIRPPVKTSVSGLNVSIK